MITAKELAAMLGLSEAAVSMALNGRAGVSERTRERVLKAAEEYGYDFSRIREKQFERDHPEGNLLFLIYKKHGAVVADTPFFAELTQGIEAESRRSGYRLVVRYVYEEDSRTQFSLATKEGFGGAIILGTEMDEGDLPLLAALPFPFVLLDTYFEGAPYDSVLINNVQGAYLATSYLIAKYRTQAGYLSSSYPINNFSERADGFYKAIRRSGLSPSRSTAQICIWRAGMTRETFAATSGISLHSCASEKEHMETLLIRSGSMRLPPEEQFSMTSPGTASWSFVSHTRLSSAI